MRGRFPRLLSILMVSALLLLAACAGKPSTNAAFAGDFPDPSVVRVGNVYYAFATQGLGGYPQIQRIWSTDRVHWQATPQPEALAALPAWADNSGTWSPSVRFIGGVYVMYYSAHQSGGRHCLSIAIAPSPADQFVDKSTKPLLCQTGGETIDPELFIGLYGQPYLLWKGPNSKGVATLFAQRMSANGMTLLGEPAQLMVAVRKGWTAYNIEGPSMVYADGKYFLFYSGGNYWQSGYSMGYAVCTTPLGPCVDKTAAKPWLATHGNAKGPGGGSFFSDAAGALYIAYHAWGSKLGYRQRWHPLDVDRPGHFPQRGAHVRLLRRLLVPGAEPRVRAAGGGPGCPRHGPARQGSG